MPVTTCSYRLQQSVPNIPVSFCYIRLIQPWQSNRLFRSDTVSSEQSVGDNSLILLWYHICIRPEGATGCNRSVAFLRVYAVKLFTYQTNPNISNARELWRSIFITSNERVFFNQHFHFIYTLGHFHNVRTIISYPFHIGREKEKEEGELEKKDESEKSSHTTGDIWEKPATVAVEKTRYKIGLVAYSLWTGSTGSLHSSILSW